MSLTPMAPGVAIVDYGMGNLFSVARAFEHCGASVLVSEDPSVLRGAARLILPGVGAFADGMRGLQRRGLDGAVVEFAKSGKPLLGICLGMQMLATVGEEFGEHAGLGLVAGRVARIPGANAAGVPHKIPHVGWTELKPGNEALWQGSVLEGIGERDAVYLTHSFAMQPEDEGHTLADYSYNGVRVTAAIRKGNVTGVQFHPEKSGEVGLKIIRNFLALRG